MDLDSFIITAFCLLDDALRDGARHARLRQRGPAPVLADSEVLTIEVVGEYLGLDQDQALYAFFRRHYAHFFPGLHRVHRTTFLRQAANLWRVKEQLWQHLVAQIPDDPSLALVDSFPVPVCQFARAYRCRRFRGDAAYGKDTLVRQTFYGFRVHVRVTWPGVMTRIAVAPANVAELELVPGLTGGTRGLLVGDRNYWHPPLAETLARQDLALLTPYRWASRDPAPERSALLSRFRYRIDTVFGQLVERYHVKRVWARDGWHFQSRLLRKVLSHTLVVYLNGTLHRPLLHLASLVV